jgi:hypothetical protein
MSRLKLFIWENDGISDAYHDDGTLVILAETPQQAKEVLIQRMEDDKPLHEVHNKAWRAAVAKFNRGGSKFGFWDTPEAKALPPKPPNRADDEVTLKAMERPPDRILDVDEPQWVAFNGGGYD